MKGGVGRPFKHLLIEVRELRLEAHMLGKASRARRNLCQDCCGRLGKPLPHPVAVILVVLDLHDSVFVLT